MRRVALAICGAVLLLVGARLCVPGPNHLFETLRSSCRVHDRVTVRFYVGSGGATTSFWYSVTSQTRWSWSEREVFYAYGEPIVTATECEGGALKITAPDAVWSLTVDELLAGSSPPFLYYNGRTASDLRRGRWGPLEILRTVFGLSICLTGIRLLWVVLRRLPNKPLERSGMNTSRPIEPTSAGRSAASR